MNSNYKEMTAHKFRAKKEVRSYSVPRIGQRIELNHAFVAQDRDAETGKPLTPMAKMRFFNAEKEWRLVPRHEAGMLVFFNSPPLDTHTHLVVTSIIPSKTACYADSL